MSAAAVLEQSCQPPVKTALMLAEKYGIPVFPCLPMIAGERAKRPYTEHGFKDATRNLEQIAEWWSRWPDALVGVPTGTATKILVVDVDSNENGAHKDDGRPWYRERVNELDDPRVHRTGNGGYQLLYRMPPADVRSSAGKIAAGVDHRANGGYVIWWPAHGLEAFGPDLDELPELPQWLLEQVTTRTVSPTREGTNGGDRIGEGRRHQTLCSFAGTMRHRGMDGDAIYAALASTNATQCDPPLEDEHVRRIARDYARYPVPAGAAPERERPIKAEERRDIEVSLDDFRAYMPTHRYIFVPTLEPWPASSVDERVPWPAGPDGKPMRPSKWLDKHHPVEQMTWSPGEPQLIEDRLLLDGGWIERKGVTIFNLYRPPAVRHGDSDAAALWLDHVRRIYPNEHEHIVRWLAQRVQHPGVKINHALVLGGKQGIGKDTLLEPVMYAVGPWNFVEVSPPAMLGRFNGFVKSVILRISEARDLGDVDRFAFYDHMKVYTAAPPDVLRCDEKNLREHSVLNVCGVIITTNHKSDGIYLPADDRRHFVAWSDADKADFPDTYWQELWQWYARGGIENVAAYLAQFDLSAFDPKAPPPKTDAFFHIVDAARALEEAELADVIESLGNPTAVTLDMLTAEAKFKYPEFAAWLGDRRNGRQIPHRLEGAGYESVRNDADKRDGLWRIGGRRQRVYARRELSLRDRIMAVNALSGGR